MFFQKVFHVHQSLADTRRQLSRLGTFRARVPGLKKALITADGVAQFECEVDPRLGLHAVLVELPSDEENAVLFHSTVGNVRVAGMVELRAVRPGLTEVHLTVDYCLRSLIARAFDFCTRRVERYVEKSLRCLQSCLNGDSGSCASVKALNFTAHQLQPAH